MAKKKFYAVRKGNIVGIYETWGECEAQIKGVSGAEYKSFLTLKEAEEYMSGETSVIVQTKTVSNEDLNQEINQKIIGLNEHEVIAFVDGSFNSTQEKSGFGVIIIDNKSIETPLYKSFTRKFNKEFIELRNVAAELEGVKEAILWSIKYKKNKIAIYYDYEGIEKWANGKWKANKDLTQKYVAFIQEYKKHIDISFVKVPAHEGIKYNERADALAKQSLLEKGYKTYDNGSIYFVTYSVSDWETMIQIICEENIELGDGKTSNINIEKEVLDNRTRLVVTRNRDRVTINCYNNSRSYLQGKQSVLFQRIVTTAIELMQNNHSVIELLNRIHVLDITQIEVERKFESLLPNYSGSRNDKHYNNLLSAVYNSMLTGYMPDYTCLITPIFRTYEYLLHKILGEKMKLSTADKNGKNNFGYFQKKSSGKYECTASAREILTVEQLDFLNNLYNEFNLIRHPYTHWSSDDIDTAVITEIAIAIEYLLKGLTIVNRYYKIF